MCTSVMVVDDDSAVRKTIEMMLAVAGPEDIEVSFAAGGGECLERIEAGFRGLILMDIMMPGMTGWQTIAAIRDRGMLAGNVICVMTALLDARDDDREDLDECVRGYLFKPFDIDELSATIRYAAAAASSACPGADRLSAGARTQ